MFFKIRKRDGYVVEFDSDKITRAIFNAGRATGEYGQKESEHLKDLVIVYAQKNINEAIPSVEQIQDIVENILLNSMYKKSAKAYILYRDQHKKLREITNQMNNGLVDDYLSRADWQVKENSKVWVCSTTN